MAVTGGFYNSLNNDRKYDAQQLSSMFDGIITDGVFKGVGGQLLVEDNTGMQIIVRPGRAWFNQTWTLNDSDLYLTLDPSDPILNRIDTVIVEVDTRTAYRVNSIKVLKGANATTPVASTLINTNGQYQYALCTIYVDKNITNIVQAKITNLIGTVSCPYVTLIDAQNEIGDRLYTQENYVADNQTLTESIDDLDIAFFTQISATNSAVSTLSSTKQANITGAATTITTNNLAIDKVVVSNGLGKIAAAVISAIELGHLSGVTSNIQAQLNALVVTFTANRVMISNGTGVLSASTITTTELGYLSGATSNIQAQLNSLGGTFTASRVIVSNSSGVLSASTINTTELGYLSGASSNLQAQINTLSGGMVLTANRAIITDSSGNLTASSITSTELGYLSGVTSAIQTQLGNKQATIIGAATTIAASNLATSRAVVSDGSGKIAAATTTSTEIGYVNGVTSAIQTQLNAKLGSTAQAVDSAKVGGRTIFHSATEPVGAVNGDIWLKPAA